LSEKQTAADFIEDKDTAKSKIKALNASNNAKTISLAKEGISPDAGVIALWKVQALIDTIMTTEEAKIIFEYNFEVTRQKFLNDFLKELRQMKLVEGVQAAKSKLTIPGR